MKRAARSTLFLILVAAVVCVGLVGASLAAPLRTPTNPGTTSLVAWWSLNEESGTRADSAGSNNLTDNNTVGYTAGVEANAAHFVAANSESLSIADNPNLTFGNAFVVGGWIYTDTTGAVQGVLSKLWTTDYEVYLDIEANSKPTLYVSADGSTTVLVYYASAISLSAWHFIVGWLDPADAKLRLQVDDGTIAVSSGTVTSVFSGGHPLYFGTKNYLNQYLNGDLDAMFVYTGRVLSADERTWLYNSGSGRRYCEVANDCPEFQTATASALTATFEANQTATAAQATANYWANETATAVALTATAESWTHTPTPTATYTPTNTPTATATIDLTRMAAIPTWAYGSTISYGDVATFNALACLIVVAALFAIGWLVMRLIGQRGGGG